jgi:hypothetical protein
MLQETKKGDDITIAIAFFVALQEKKNNGNDAVIVFFAPLQ